MVVVTWPLAQTYDRRTIALHWSVAALVLLLWGGAHAIDWFPKGPLRVDCRSAHIVVGVLVLAAMVYRAGWRATGGTKIEQPASLAYTAARGMHLALYALVFATLALGVTNAWVRGDSLFGLFRIPAFGAYAPPARHALSEQLVGWHALGANLVLALAGLHAATALYHHFVLKDGVLRRMLPPGRPLRGE